jgi:hypothetical protein
MLSRMPLTYDEALYPLSPVTYIIVPSLPQLDVRQRLTALETSRSRRNKIDMDLLQALLGPNVALPQPLRDTPAGVSSAATSVSSAGVHDGSHMAVSRLITPPTEQDSSSPTQQSRPKSKVICTWFYHKGECRKDASRVTLAEGVKACPHLHELPGNLGEQDASLSHVSAWQQKTPCGKLLCKWKDEVPTKKAKGERAKESLDKQVDQVGASGLLEREEASSEAGAGVDTKTAKKKGTKKKKGTQAEPLTATPPKSVTRLQKTPDSRKRKHVPHRDDLIGSDKKRMTLSYNDSPPAIPQWAQQYERMPSPSPARPYVPTQEAEEQSASPTRTPRSSKASEQTCFFWYVHSSPHWQITEKLT